MRYLHETLLSSGDQTADFTSDAIDASYLVSASAVITTSAAITGASAKLQASNDASNILGGPVNWVDIPNTSVSIGAQGSFLIPMTNISYQWLRLVYTGGTGAGNVTINFKALGF